MRLIVGLVLVQVALCVVIRSPDKMSDMGLLEESTVREGSKQTAQVDALAQALDQSNAKLMADLRAKEALLHAVAPSQKKVRVPVHWR